MKPTDVATAISNSLVQGGSAWLISTIVAFLPALWTMALMLHLGRPYVLRTLRRCGLRLGADVWWMSYLLMRDAVLLITFALSWVFFEPNIVYNAALPITGPLAALCLLLALAVKLSYRVDDDVTAYRWFNRVFGHRRDAVLWPAGLRRRGDEPVVPGWFRGSFHQQQQPVGGADHHVGGASRRGASRAVALRSRLDGGKPLDGKAHGSEGTSAGACASIARCSIVLKVKIEEFARRPYCRLANLQLHLNDPSTFQ